jgi:hypothetical protein
MNNYVGVEASNKSPNRLASQARRLTIEVTFTFDSR